MRVLPKQDGTCPNCQAILSPKKSAAGQKPGSAAAGVQPGPNEHSSTKDAVPPQKDTIVKDELRNAGLKTQGLDDSRRPRIRLAIEDAVWPYVALNVGVGDLLFVDSDVYYICYSPEVTQSGGAGYVVGGLVGGLSGASLDKARLDGAKQSTAGIRRQYYGLSLDERVEQLRHSLIIRNPASVVYNDRASSIICTSSTGEKTTFFVPKIAKAARALLEEFPEGEDSLYPQEDPYGLLIRASSPKVLAEMLAQGQVDEAVLDEVASNQQYMLSFYQRVRLMPGEQQGALVENLRHTPARFRASLSLTVADSQKKDSFTRKNTVTIGVIVGLILVGISPAFLSSKNYICLGGLALLGLACLVYIPYQANRTARGQERLMQAVLDALDRGKQS